MGKNEVTAHSGGRGTRPGSLVKVVRVTQTEFELNDGRIYQHPIELEPDEVPTVEEFQDYYNHWLSLLDNCDDREVVNNG